MLASLFPALALGAGISPYLPMELPLHEQRQVDLLFALADEPVMRRPLTVAAIDAALERACPRDPALCESVQGWLRGYRAPLGVTALDAQLALADATRVPLANRQGLLSSDAWRLQASGHWQPSGHAMFSAGALAQPGEILPTGSMFSAGFDVARLDVGFRERWVSPLADSAFLQSTQAPAMFSVGVSNERPFTRARIRYDMYISRMSRSERILDGGVPTAGHPLLAGLSLSMQPAPGWSLGAARQMQFGGGSRDSSPVSFLQAFFAPNHYDNFRAGRPEEFGNQQAAWSASFIYPGARPVIISMEFAGDDTSRGTSGRLGNAGLSLGLQMPRISRTFGLRYEFSEWQNNWYTHHIYPDGMINRGQVIGHWGAARRVPGDHVGGISHSLALQWMLPRGRTFDLRARLHQNPSYTAVAYRNAMELGATWSAPWGPLQAGAELLLGRDVFGERYYRLSAIARRQSTSDLADGAVGEAGRPEGSMFFDVGAALGRLRISRRRGGPEAQWLASHLAAHVGVGLRRPVWRNSDLGVRLELDPDGQRSLVAVRALDFRYRIAPKLAVTAFLGAARMNRPIPAYGYYAGGGLQWRDARPRWDVNLDLRFGDKLASDDLDANGQLLGNENTYSDLFSAAVYLSRRF